MSFRAILVDDDNAAITHLCDLLEEEPDVDVVGTAESLEQALELCKEEKPDVLFLDIQLGGNTPFELIGRLSPNPSIIFTTAYQDHALDTFDTNAIDFLLKPVEKEKIHGVLNKLHLARLRQHASYFSEQLNELIHALETIKTKLP